MRAVLNMMKSDGVGQGGNLEEEGRIRVSRRVTGG